MDLGSSSDDREWTEYQELMDNPETQDDGKALSKLKSLHDAVRDRDEDTVRSLLDHGVSLRTKTSDGQTPLHLAVNNDDKSMAQLLLERGADAEAADGNGKKALYAMTESDNLALVELLLHFGANVESFNLETKRTAFFQAAEMGHIAVAEVLLKNRADIDTKTSNGHTPLFSAVIRGDLKIAKFLLRHGASKKVQDEDGQTMEDFATKNIAMMNLLHSPQLVQGPSITNPKKNANLPFTAPSLPVDQVDKLNACHGFQATIVDFFEGENEQRIEVWSSIYEILYGKGPESIMASARRTEMGEQQPRFRWYHLPANNVWCPSIFQFKT
jgi:ankyrin repeat protein